MRSAPSGARMRSVLNGHVAVRKLPGSEAQCPLVEDRVAGRSVADVTLLVTSDDRRTEHHEGRDQEQEERSEPQPHGTNLRAMAGLIVRGVAEHDPRSLGRQKDRHPQRIDKSGSLPRNQTEPVGPGVRRGGVLEVTLPSRLRREDPNGVCCLCTAQRPTRDISWRGVVHPKRSVPCRSGWVAKSPVVEVSWTTCSDSPDSRKTDRRRHPVALITLAETGGFEPPGEFHPSNRLAGGCFRPLSHVSAHHPSEAPAR